MEELKPAAVIPRTAVRLHVAFQILAALVLLLAANYFSFNYFARGDFSRSQKFVLADQTRRVLRDLKKPVRVTVFFSRTQLTPETQLFPDVQNLLKELSFSRRDKLVIEYVDPTRDLTRARELQGQYKFSAGENVIILDYDGRVKFVPVADMGDFDLNPVMTGDPPRLLAFKGEQAITNALIALARPERLKVLFLQGHGELGAGPGSPLSKFSDYVERQNVRADAISLASTDQIPPDCAALILAAPQSDLEEREAVILERYWKNKGRVFLLLDPAIKAPRLDAFLEKACILPQDTRVLKIIKNPLLANVTGIWRTVTGEFLPLSTVTKRLVGMNIVFPGATKSFDLEVKKSQSAGIQLWPLIVAGEEFWGESDYITDEKKGVHYDEGKDDGYPVYVAVAAAQGGVNDDRIEVESAKLIAVGNCEFALDSVLTPQGLDFLLSSMNWLLDRSSYTGVMPKAVQHFSLNLSEAQLRSITFYVLIVIPAVAGLLGLIAWWRRRA